MPARGKNGQVSTAIAISQADCIGRASAVACKTLGARVIATDINSELLSERSEAHPEISTLQLDVCDGQAVDDMAATVGAVDGLFNCAGMVHHGSILELSDDD